MSGSIALQIADFGSMPASSVVVVGEAVRKLSASNMPRGMVMEATRRKSR